MIAIRVKTMMIVMSKKGIENEEQLLLYLKATEKIAHKNFRHWQAEKDKQYNQLWETGVERKMLKLLASSSQDVFDKWLEIEGSHKETWIKNLKKEHADLKKLDAKINRNNSGDLDQDKGR